MYSSDRMKTLIILFKDYDKSIVSKDCQMHYFYIHLRRKEIFLIFFRQFVELPAKNSTVIGLLLRLSDISRDWERLQRTTTLHGRLFIFVKTIYFLSVLRAFRCVFMTVVSLVWRGAVFWPPTSIPALSWSHGQNTVLKNSKQWL